MTQDAPLDQTAPIDADVLRKFVPGFRLDWSGLRNRFDDIAARLDKLTTYESRAAYLDEIARNFEDAVSDALSRRVPASGGEADAGTISDLIFALRKAADEVAGWGAGNEAGTIRRAAHQLYLLNNEVDNLRDAVHEANTRSAASPIVAAPEGLLHEIVSIINTYGLTQVPAGETRPELKRLRELVDLAAAPSIPEGKAEPGETAVIERCAKAVEAERDRWTATAPYGEGRRSGFNKAIAAIRALSTSVQHE